MFIQKFIFEQDALRDFTKLLRAELSSTVAMGLSGC